VTANAARLVAALGVVTITTLGGVSRPAAQEHVATAEIAQGRIAQPPADFSFMRTGEGALGQWTIVADATATQRVAIEHVSTDPHQDRFPLAIYTPVTAENVKVSVRFKIVSGTMLAAGIALGVRDPDHYYAVSASALEHRVDLLLFVGGKAERIESAEADVTQDHWHALSVTANDDHFAVSLDQRLLFTTFDRVRMKDGRIALWAQEDNVTRFDQLEIRVLPPTEWR
jgi:hypothetical protein